MTAGEIIGLLQTLEARFRAEEQALNGLDRAVGDGDHGATMVRGFAAMARRSSDGESDAGALLSGAADDFMAASGGASGTLFAALFSELGSHCGRDLDAPAFAAGLAAATDRIRRIGKAETGDKTMIDALAPACAAVGEIGEAAALPAVVAAAAAPAVHGAEATADMVARRGRARYVAEGGKGHVDPGARSVALILEAIAAQAEAAA